MGAHKAPAALGAAVKGPASGRHCKASGRLKFFPDVEPFHHCTLELKGHKGNGALYDLLPIMDYLLEHLETVKHHYTASNSTPHLISSIQLPWEKLNKYYTLTDSNTAVYAAVALYSGMKFEYFEINWAEHPD